jgi:hypothetical protein
MGRGKIKATTDFTAWQSHNQKTKETTRFHQMDTRKIKEKIL